MLSFFKEQVTDFLHYQLGKFSLGLYDFTLICHFFCMWTHHSYKLREPEEF